MVACTAWLSVPGIGAVPEKTTADIPTLCMDHVEAVYINSRGGWSFWMRKNGSATFEWGSSVGDSASIKPGVLAYEQVMDRILKSGLHSDTIQADPRHWLVVNFVLQGKSRAQLAVTKDESDSRKMLRELLPLAEPLQPEGFRGLLRRHPLFPPESEQPYKSGGWGTTVPTIRFPRSFQEGVSPLNNTKSDAATKDPSASKPPPKQ